MSLTERIEAGQAEVHELRSRLDQVREALDRTDAVLGTADEALARADQAVARTRAWAPRLALVVGVAAVVALGVVIARRRHRPPTD